MGPGSFFEPEMSDMVIMVCGGSGESHASSMLIVLTHLRSGQLWAIVFRIHLTTAFVGARKMSVSMR